MWTLGNGTSGSAWSLYPRVRPTHTEKKCFAFTMVQVSDGVGRIAGVLTLSEINVRLYKTQNSWWG